MKVVIFGSTGPTGLLITDRALAAGHEVRAFVRTPSKLTVSGDRLSVVQGDIYDADSVARAVDGMEAVVCTVGVPYTRKPVTLYSAAARNILAAMEAHDVTRLVGITSGGTYPGRDPNNPFFFERILKPVFHTLYDDMREMERIVAASDRAWTILRPPRLLDKPATGKTRTSVDAFSVPKGSTISRADLADVVVHQLTSDELVGHAAAVAD